MNIAYVCADPGVPVFGAKGCSVHVQEVIRALRRAGARVVLFTSRVGGEAPADLDDLAVVTLPPVTGETPAAREIAALRANEALRRLLQDAWACEPFDLLYERYSLWSFAAFEVARKRRAPSLMEVNAPLIEEQARYRQLVDRSGAEACFARASAAASAIVAVSGAVAEAMRKRLGDAPPVHIIPNAVDPVRFHPGVPALAAPESSASPGQVTIGFVGTLKPWHGLRILLQAFVEVCRENLDVRLLIVGDGPERLGLVEHLKRNELLDRASLTGAVLPRDVPGWVNTIDIAVAPYEEAQDCYFSPLKLFEYMAAGRAIIASDVGQIGEILEHGRTGLLIPPGDAVALAAALRELVASVEMRQALGAAARQVAVSRYTWDSVAQRIMELASAARSVDDRAILRACGGLQK